MVRKYLNNLSDFLKVNCLHKGSAWRVKRAL